MKLESGQEVVHTKAEENEEFSKDFEPYKNGLVRIQPGNWLLYPPFLKYADKLYNFKFRPTDVIIMTYPKCGTTWMQEIVWTMRNNLTFNHPDADVSVLLRATFIDSDFLDDPSLGVGDLDENFKDYFDRFCPGKDPKDGVFLQIAEDTPDPRTIKTHLPFSFFQPDMLDVCKVIFVARNPKDVCYSYFHHHRLFKAHGYQGTWDSFIHHFLNDNLIYSPYWPMLKQAWEQRNHPNLMFCYYEEMRENPKKIIEQVDDFIKSGLTEEDIDKVVDYTSFASMKTRDPFIGSDVPEWVNGEVLKENGGFFRRALRAGLLDCGNVSVVDFKLLPGRSISFLQQTME